jgi:hypothetical protein
MPLPGSGTLIVAALAGAASRAKSRTMAPMIEDAPLYEMKVRVCLVPISEPPLSWSCVHPPAGRLPPGRPPRTRPPRVPGQKAGRSPPAAGSNS